MLDTYRNMPNIEIVGMGYYHPIFPLIPMRDWDEQMDRGGQKIREIFGGYPKIFWPPEMAFTMEMILALVRHGYESVIIDSVHVRPKEPLGRQETVYRTHIAEHDGARIVVIPRDRDLSNAQESGLDPNWFAGEVTRKTGGANRPCLVTTWTDGENGGWFRQTDEAAGFWGHFFAPHMERVRSGQMPVSLTSVDQFIAENPPTSSVEVQTGAWNVGATGGYDFSQWAGSATQRKALQEIWQLSQAYHEIRRNSSHHLVEAELSQAREYLLRGETSCYLFWGESWIPKLYENTGNARRLWKRSAGPQSGNRGIRNHVSKSPRHGGRVRVRTPSTDPAPSIGNRWIG